MEPYGHSEVLKVLNRLLSNGPLSQMPRRRGDLEILLALAATQLRRKSPLSEAEVNEALKGWLSSFCSPYSVDHVTIRRYLVDFRLVDRNREGSTYQVVDGNINRIIDPSAQQINPERVLEEVMKEREIRKRQRRLDSMNHA